MSVEKHTGVSAAAPSSQDEKTKTDAVQEDSVHSDLSEMSTNAARAAAVEEDGGAHESHDTSRVFFAEKARNWFMSLGDEERIEVLGFMDGPFVEMLLEVSSWSPPPTGRSPAVGAHVGHGMDWSSLVSLNAALSAYTSSLERRQSSNGVDENGKDAPGQPLSNRITPYSDSGIVEDLTGNKELRIPQRSEDAPGASSNEVECLESQSSRVLTEGLCDHICITFPSALHCVVGANADQASDPYVTLDPSYVENLGDGELFLALDSLSRMTFSSPFLSIENFTRSEERPLWFNRLHFADDSLPLCSLLLARFESAVAEHFLAHQGKINKLRPSLDASGDSDGMLPVEEEDSSAEQYASAHENEASLEENSTAILASSNQHSSRLWHSLTVHSRALDDIGLAVDSLTLKAFMEPFTSSLKLSSEVLKNFRPGHMILTPAPFIVDRTTRSKLNLVDVDRALSMSLSLMKQHGASDNSKVGEEMGKSGDTDVPVTGNISLLEDLPAAAQKKRRKKPKKKKKRPMVEAIPGIGKELEQATNAYDEPSKANGEAEEVAEAAPQDLELALVSHKACDSGESDVVDTRADTVSVRSDLSIQEPPADPGKRNDITVSRVEGVLVVAPPLPDSSKPDLSPGDDDVQNGGLAPNRDDDEEWETVETKSRGNRRKPSDRTPRNHSHQSYSTSSSLSDYHSGNKKAKGARTAASRKKMANRKLVREILFSVLDSVDEEVRKRKLSASRQFNDNGAHASPGTVKAPAEMEANAASTVAESPPAKKEVTLRDVLLGKHLASAKTQVQVENRLPRLDESGSVTKSITEPKKDSKAETEPSAKTEIGKRIPGQGPTPADQNTAPTYQETVSAVSTSSNAAVESKDPVSAGGRRSKCDSSSSETGEVPQDRDRVSSTSSIKDASPAPPLPTLLSPENANSATSSVASSLEVPHAGHRHHHSNNAGDFNDVGYHLLDVCDRLSQDMSLFMSRRALALNGRRRERGALLAALQETVSSIWPVRSHVEMYGSCATQLDLPSSDLDVVVLGLDRSMEMMMSPPQTPQNLRSKAPSSERIRKNDSMEEGGTVDGFQTQPITHHFAWSPYWHSMNQERVLRLAAELEGQAWAVQVRAIPTAAVPVIKVLADASRLAGAYNGSEWVSHQHVQPSLAEDDGTGQLFQQQTMLPWRGSDVMNGLLPLDITFEGPEHGGIGSTEFSARVVADACQETGLLPDATPLVQVLMVLKELLAQRKLNEPYSGGLSSYALLLLVVALLRERAVIREEIERVERQKKAMASVDETSSSTFSIAAGSAPPVDVVTSCANSDVDVQLNGTGQVPVVVSLSSEPAEPSQFAKSGRSRPEPIPRNLLIGKPSPDSSWAVIAKKNSDSKERLGKDGQSDAGSSSGGHAMANATKKALVDSATGAGLTPRAPEAKDSHSRESVPTGPASNLKRSESLNPAPLVTSGQTSPLLIDQFERSRLSNAYTINSVTDGSLVGGPTYFPQGFNDVIEVLCSGETTAGKLLMHFLLYYGEHFDSSTTAIDISGKHERGFPGHTHPYSYMSPYIQRRAPGSIDPVTGMLTVDPIVIYDPLEGAEHNNVARRCFAWTSVRWIFAQSYATLSSAVERSGTPPTTPGGKATGPDGRVPEALKSTQNAAPSSNCADVGDLMDPASPLLRCLLSF